MTPLLNNRPLPEHFGYPLGSLVEGAISERWDNIYFNGDITAPCVSFANSEGQVAVSTSYYVGTDWLDEGVFAVYVAPKLNHAQAETNYLEMLFCALSQTDVGDELPKLFQMKADKPFIQLKAQQDLLTPLLVLQFLQVTRRILQKGLKRSYYEVTQTLRSRVKGKVLVARTIKSATLKNKPLDTVCSYSEFGYNSTENRILKKTLGFAQRYLLNSGMMRLKDEPYSALLAYVRPQFESVSNEASLTELRNIKLNPFYKEYREALTLAQLILQRYAFNINTASQQDKVMVPPFWIDMSKLFELYVLGELRKKYPVKSDVVYQQKAGSEYPDFLLKSKRMVIDAKYKPAYDSTHERADIRQLSGYARNREVLRVFGLEHISEEQCPVLPCWIIYPARLAKEGGEGVRLCDAELTPIEGYISFFKSPISLPKQPDKR